MQSTICLKLQNKVTNIFPTISYWGCKWERIWNALENALKNGLKGAKSGQLKIESMSESANRKNDKCVWDALDDTTQGPPDNTPGVAPKGELQYSYT